MTKINDQIKQLRTEAGQAGDLEQVETCDRALAGDQAARAECARIVAEAAAEPFEPGDRVEGGEGADQDTGTIRRIHGGLALISWDSGVATECPLRDLQAAS